MKHLILLALLLTVYACAEYKGYARSETNESYRIYDKDGNFSGRIDGSYRVYDKDGRFIGMIRK